jgi:uncharacterized surface protein with fasciclin (FAS1) repeats
MFRTTLLAGATALTAALPAAAADLRAVAEEDGRFSTLLTALDASDAGWFLEEDMTYTLFAPTDEAFGKLPEGVLDALLRDENRPKLNAILERHVVPEQEVMSGDLSDGQMVDPATGEPLRVSLSGDSVTIGEASVVAADIDTDQGVVHAIDTVLVPELVVQAMKFTGDWPAE